MGLGTLLGSHLSCWDGLGPPAMGVMQNRDHIGIGMFQILVQIRENQFLQLGLYQCLLEK